MMRISTEKDFVQMFNSLDTLHKYNRKEDLHLP